MLDKDNAKTYANKNCSNAYNEDNAKSYRMKGINKENNAERKILLQYRCIYRAAETTCQDPQQCSRFSEVPTFSNELSGTIP